MELLPAEDDADPLELDLPEPPPLPDPPVVAVWLPLDLVLDPLLGLVDEADADADDEPVVPAAAGVDELAAVLELGEAELELAAAGAAPLCCLITTVVVLCEPAPARPISTPTPSASSSVARPSRSVVPDDQAARLGRGDGSPRSPAAAGDESSANRGGPRRSPHSTQ